MNAMRATPSASRSAVSNDSARRWPMSARTLNRSTTASMLCLRLGRAWAAHPARRPCRRRARARSPVRAVRSKTCACSPLRSWIIGASSSSARAFGQLQHLIDHLADGLRRQIDAVIRAARSADARKQQAQVVVDFGDGADRRTRIVRGRLLLDRDRGRQALDGVHIRLFHHRQKLPRIGRQRFDIAPLPFGIDGVEGERRLARARQARENDQPVARQLEVDVAQIVRARAADDGWTAWLLEGLVESAGRDIQRTAKFRSSFLIYGRLSSQGNSGCPIGGCRSAEIPLFRKPPGIQ